MITPTQHGKLTRLIHEYAAAYGEHAVLEYDSEGGDESILKLATRADRKRYRKLDALRAYLDELTEDPK